MSADGRERPLGIRRAGLLDLEQLWQLRAQASSWLAGEGVEHWSGAGWDANWWEKTTLSVLAGRTWVVDDRTRPGSSGVVATIAFGAPDMDFWEAEEDRWFARDADASAGRTVTPGGPAAAAVYFYRFAVAASFRGQRLGEALLDWAEGWATMEGRRFLRCDCSRANTRLHRYYERVGFRHVRTVESPHRASGALFERPVGVRTYEGPIKLWSVTDPDAPPAGVRDALLGVVERRVEELRASVEA